MYIHLNFGRFYRIILQLYSKGCTLNHIKEIHYNHMASEIINISKQEGNNHLYLTDNEGHVGPDTITTNVKPGDTVTWRLVPNGGIDQITGITAKASSHDIFSVDPSPVNPNDPASDWTGTVSPDATGSESYSIDYKIGGKSLKDDPRLKVNT